MRFPTPKPSRAPRRLLAALLALAFAPGIAAGAEKVTFCFNYWPPFTHNVEDRVVGISVELIDEAARRLGVTVEYQELPWNRCLQYVRNGVAHAVVDAAAREEFVQGPTSLGIYSDTLWVHSASAIESPEDLRNARIGLVDGYRYSDEIMDMIARLGMTPELSVDDPANLRKLAFRRTDAAIADLMGTLVYAREHRLMIRPLYPPLSSDPLYLSFHAKYSDLQKRFDAAFREMLAEGFVDRVYEAHIGERFSDLLAPD